MEKLPETKHTPGPWRVVPTNDSNMPFYIHEEPKYQHEGSEGLILAQIVPINDSLIEEANAKIIAAAPEMLSLLGTAVGYLETNSVLQIQIMKLLKKATR